MFSGSDTTRYVPLSATLVLVHFLIFYIINVSCRFYLILCSTMLPLRGYKFCIRKFQSSMGSFCVAFVCSPCVCVGFQKTCAFKLIVDSKLDLVVSCPGFTGNLYRVCSCLLSDHCCDRLQQPLPPWPLIDVGGSEQKMYVCTHVCVHSGVQTTTTQVYWVSVINTSCFRINGNYPSLINEYYTMGLMQETSSKLEYEQKIVHILHIFLFC